tara:strand:+ start:354 stop:1340 length:987 start_codon:yes stop_codon:yes gene_type:complete
MDKKRILLFAEHSAWGAASNFNEMFSNSNKYESIEIVAHNGGKNGYSFGQDRNLRKEQYSRSEEIKALIEDPSAIFFIFDVNGLHLFLKCMNELGENIKNRPLNIFWSGNPYIANHLACNEWVDKSGVTPFAMLDLISYNKKSIPLMQPYNTEILEEIKIKSPKVEGLNDFVICHSPGHKGRGNEKGTNIIKSAIDSLNPVNSIKISYNQLGSETWLTHSECLLEKAKCDLFIDKIGSLSAGGIGKSGIEGICMGIPTLSAMHKSTISGRYESLDQITCNSGDTLISEINRLIADTEYYQERQGQMKNLSNLFSYKNTLEYIEQEMSK